MADRTRRNPPGHDKEHDMTEKNPKGSYAESRDEQAEFEELEREEGDWQKAVDDVEEGKKPKEEPDTASSGF
jgi:hypothetical protein